MSVVICNCRLCFCVVPWLQLIFGLLLPAEQLTPSIVSYNVSGGMLNHAVTYYFDTVPSNVLMLFGNRENQAGKVPETKRVMIFCFNRELISLI